MGSLFRNAIKYTSPLLAIKKKIPLSFHLAEIISNKNVIINTIASIKIKYLEK